MIAIVHTPYGQEHPYEQLPEERFPRDPLAGQLFKAGAVVRPPAAVRRVRVQQRLNGQPLPPIDAVKLPDWRPELEHGVGAEFLERIVQIEQDVWQAELIAPPVGQTLTYWFEAETPAGEIITSAQATLCGEAWTRGGGAHSDDLCAVFSPEAVGAVLPDGTPELRAIEWLSDGQRARRVRLHFTCAPDERFFGLGERFNALDQRGNVLDIRVYEQYKNQGKRTYFPVPFLVSSAGYGVWVQSSRWMQFDLAAANPDEWVLEADLQDDQTLTLQWFTGDPLDITAAFTRMTGPAALPPAWAFGLWLSGNEWNTQARVEQEVDTALTHDIQPTVMVIEAWSDETTFYIWNDALYTPKDGASIPRLADFTFPPEGKWPDPKGMIDRLHERGVRLLLWQIPVLKALDEQADLPAHVRAQHEADRAHFEARGYGVHEPDGSLHRVRPFWFRGGYLWDVTNLEARAWWLAKRAYLLEEMGIDGFKTDGGEHLWSTAARFADGRTGSDVWNEYPRLYSEAYYRFANDHREAITFSRAGFTGSQRAPLHWAGDENSTWDAFRHSILAGLSAGISGIPFWGWDLGGFSGETPPAELYLRAAAMAAFCPVMQLHSEYNQHRENRDRTPWNIQRRTGDERVIPLFRHFVNVRYNLMPYIWREAQHSAQTGEPMMRALKVTHPEASDYAYFFGRDLLVFPVVEAGAATWEVALPPGIWTDLWTGARFAGGAAVIIDAPLERIPVFIRTGAILPVRLGDEQRLGASIPFGIEPDGEIRA